MNEKKENKEKPNTFIKELGSWAMALIFAVILALFIKTFIFTTTLVDGNSMNPTLIHSDRLIALKFTLFFDTPDRGDIIIFDSPYNPDEDFIKRVIGVAGDEVRIEDGSVYVNGKKIDEYYIEEDINTLTENTDHWQVGEGKLFVLGDNREFKKSTDSRVFGEIPVDIVQGHAVFRYYPLNRIGVVK